MDLYIEEGIKKSWDKTGRAVSSTWEFTVSGTTDRDVAEAHAQSIIPLYDGTLILETVELDELSDAGRDGIWKGTARYIVDADQGGGDGGGADPVAREISVSIDVSQTTANVTHGKDIQKYDITPGNPGPDFKGAINVDQAGKINGENIFFSETSFSIVMEFPTDELTNAFFSAIEALASPPKKNDGTFRGRAAGEVLFLGVTGTVEYEKAVNQITYKYRIQENMDNEDFGPFEGVTKKGWDLAWVYSESQEIGGRTILSPVSLYIVEVYADGDLASVGVTA